MTSPITLLKAWNLKPKKQLGQNFLSDPSTAGMIVNRAGLEDDNLVLEIGAGLGALTIPISRLVKKVYAIETDRALLKLLNTELLVHDASNVEAFKQNILSFDLLSFARQNLPGQKLVVMGNLPYNISSQVLVKLIDSRKVVKRAVMMFQKELALRLMAKPGVKNYGRLTVMLAYCADIKSVATISATQFFPKPKVDSEVLEIKFKQKPEYPADDEKFLFKVIKAAFGQRRKTLRNSLAGSMLEISPQDARKALETAGIDPLRRAETLSVKEFVDLTSSLSNLNPR